jgi:hypothetical protein
MKEIVKEVPTSKSDSALLAQLREQILFEASYVPINQNHDRGDSQTNNGIFSGT